MIMLLSTVSCTIIILLKRLHLLSLYKHTHNIMLHTFKVLAHDCSLAQLGNCIYVAQIQREYLRNCYKLLQLSCCHYVFQQKSIILPASMNYSTLISLCYTSSLAPCNGIICDHFLPFFDHNHIFTSKCDHRW